MDNREYFNSIAEKWDQIVFHDENKIQKIIEMMDIKIGDNVLDVGTGTGILIPFIMARIQRTGSITAVDISEKMIEVAANKYGHYDNVKFIVDDVINADLPLHYYDIVVCYSMFPHFENKQKAVDRLSLLIKQGGRLAICHSQSRESINSLHKNADDAVKNDSLPNMECMKNYFNMAGLTVVCEADNSDMFVIIGEKQYNKCSNMNNDCWLSAK